MRKTRVQLCGIFALRFLLPIPAMPPKLKSMEATQLAALVEEPVEETQQATQPVQDEQFTPNDIISQPENSTGEPALLETLPKRGRSKANCSTAAKTKLRAATANVLAMQISTDLAIHQFIVQMLLDSFEKFAVESSKESGTFRTNLSTAKLRTRKARPAGEQQRVYGKDIADKGDPERCSLKLLPTKILKPKCM